MSYTKAVTIWCDAPECNEWHDGAGGDAIGNEPTVRGAREGGRHKGWVFRNGRDLCPVHAGKSTEANRAQ